MEQRTGEWHSARLGKVTASQISSVFAKGRGVTRARYMDRLLDERQGVISDSFESEAMAWGTKTEPLARRAYEKYKGVSVEEVGFVDHPSIAWSGASPDGLVGRNGLVEIKCPNTATHIKTLEADNVPKKYIMQMQWQLACTGRKWCDFVSYDPRAPSGRRFFVKRFIADPSHILELEAGVAEFLRELDYLEGAKPDAPRVDQPKARLAANSAAPARPTKASAKASANRKPIPKSAKRSSSPPRKASTEPAKSAVDSEPPKPPRKGSLNSGLHSIGLGAIGSCNVYVWKSESVKEPNLIFPNNSRFFFVSAPLKFTQQDLQSFLMSRSDQIFLVIEAKTKSTIAKVRKIEQRILMVDKGEFTLGKLFVWSYALNMWFGIIPFWLMDQPLGVALSIYIATWGIAFLGWPKTFARQLDGAQLSEGQLSKELKELDGLMSPSSLSEVSAHWKAGTAAELGSQERRVAGSFSAPIDDAELALLMQSYTKALN